MDDWIELPLMDGVDLAMPPTLHAAPATSQPQLAPFEWVTYGVPGAYWLVDAAQVYSAPQRSAGGRELYQVVPTAEYGASRARCRAGHQDSNTVHTYSMWTDTLWVYRPVPGERTVDDLEPVGLADWMDRVQPDLLTPPPIRRPRPARELPSLTGRRVVVPGIDLPWLPAIACSEPFEADGRVSVQVMFPDRYYTHVFQPGSTIDEDVKTLGLHMIWAY